MYLTAEKTIITVELKVSVGTQLMVRGISDISPRYPAC